MPIKIAVVGTGNVAVGNYLPYLATQPNVALGCFNRSGDKAAMAAKQFGGEVFSSLGELAAWKPTATLVLTSETARYEIATELIDLGVRRLFFEKPLVAALGQENVSEDDFFKGKALLNLAAQRGCETAMVFNYRFFDQTLKAKKIAQERSFGAVINITGLVHYACWSHAIDLIHHFAGPVEEIAALGGTITRVGGGNEAVDISAALRLSNGAIGTLIGTAGMKWQHPLFELTLTFENGRIHLRDLDGDLEVLDGASQSCETHGIARDKSRWDQYKASFEKSLSAYLDSLRAGMPPPVAGMDGLRELQVEAALRRSIAQRRPVLVQEEFSLAG